MIRNFSETGINGATEDDNLKMLIMKKTKNSWWNKLKRLFHLSFNDTSEKVEDWTFIDDVRNHLGLKTREETIAYLKNLRENPPKFTEEEIKNMPIL